MFAPLLSLLDDSFIHPDHGNNAMATAQKTGKSHYVNKGSEDTHLS